MKKIAIIVLMFNLVLAGSFYYKLNKSYQVVDQIIYKRQDKESLKIEEYLIGVVACEMPASFHEEALKAQAVSARTYLYNELSKDLNKQLTDDDQCFNTVDEMKNKWKDEYEKYYEKISNAVKNTKDLVMKKDGNLFKSYYFSTSNGYTESSLSVFNEQLLDSVASEWDKSANNYEVNTTFNKSSLEKILGSFSKIEIISRNNTNHVLEVKVDDKTYTGIEFRKLLNLRSTDFTIKQDNDNYIITTKGYGHGVGMSQYGANYLANNNYNYQEILEYYYQNIEIVKI